MQKTEALRAGEGLKTPRIQGLTANTERRAAPSLSLLRHQLFFSSRNQHNWDSCKGQVASPLSGKLFGRSHV